MKFIRCTPFQRGVTFFQGDGSITKNSNWEVLTKNLVTFKRQDGVKDEKLQYFGEGLDSLPFLGKGGGAWQERGR